MALFNRKNKKTESDQPTQKEKVKFSKRPANTAFKQQRLKAWQPILTPKAVLPTLFLVGLLFAPIGALIVWGSGKVTTITLDYTQCDSEAPTGPNFEAMPAGRYSYDLATGSSATTTSTPQWIFSNDSTRPVGQRAQCQIDFQVPYNLGPHVFLYYKLTNYYQNHRRYVQSFDADQLKGNYRSASNIDDSNCKPITTRDGKPIYPCGLIANSLFNDTFPSVTLLNPPNGAEAQVYNFTERNIAWSGLAKQYAATPGYGSPSDALPPPNWKEQYPDDYTDSFPNLAENEHFQVWMRVAALPTFRKLWARNDNEVMTAGTYRVLINMNYPVKQFDGTKSVVISTVSWIGGKQPFLGWAYIGGAILCVLLAVAGLVRHLVKPRKLGDMSLLSWNQAR